MSDFLLSNYLSLLTFSSSQMNNISVLDAKTNTYSIHAY
jgi:hypothetical protein